MTFKLTATAAATAVLLAACTNASTSTRSAVADAASITASHAGTQAQALAEARHLLAQFRLPPGTKPVALSTLPPQLRGHSGPGAGWAAASEFLQAPQDLHAISAFLAGPPLSMPVQDGPALPAGMGTFLAAPAPGIDAALVSVEVVPYANGKALIAAYAYAAWLPYRTAAEDLDPSRFRSVTAAERFFFPPGPATTRTFTSPVTIATLAELLNASAPEPEYVLAGRHCAPVGPTYTLRFTPKPSRGPAVEVIEGPCSGTAIKADGQPQPTLWDIKYRLAAAISALIGNPQPAPVNTSSLASPP
jgi:hypothetical protein